MTPTFSPELIGWYFVSGGTQIKYSREGIWPSTYLAYAQADFEGEKDARTLVNTVSNAKRALHYQVEGLADAFGWNHFKKRDDFPTRLNFLGLCGVLSPTIIRRINRMRNSVEHDYYTPTEDEALEYLEIVELYLGATHRTATYFPDDVQAELMADSEDYDPTLNYPPYIHIKLPEGEGHLTVTSGKQVIVDIAVSDPQYFKWVSAIIKQNAA
jgi:hypothetical protein